jgi:hypothetical protein
VADTITCHSDANARVKAPYSATGFARWQHEDHTCRHVLSTLRQVAPAAIAPSLLYSLLILSSLHGCSASCSALSAALRCDLHVCNSRVYVCSVEETVSTLRCDRPQHSPLSSIPMQTFDRTQPPRTATASLHAIDLKGRAALRSGQSW